MTLFSLKHMTPWLRGRHLNHSATASLSIRVDNMCIINYTLMAVSLLGRVPLHVEFISLTGEVTNQLPDCSFLVALSHNQNVYCLMISGHGVCIFSSFCDIYFRLKSKTFDRQQSREKSTVSFHGTRSKSFEGIPNKRSEHVTSARSDARSMSTSGRKSSRKNRKSDDQVRYM